MQESPHVLFANSGVQLICLPLPAHVRFSAEQAGHGWQRCRCQEPGSGKDPGKIEDFSYIQWRIDTARNRMFLAVDTTAAGEGQDAGYFAKANTLEGDFPVRLRGLLGAHNKRLELDPIELLIRPAAADGGDPKDVHIVVDFGNSRTGALLLEFRGDTEQEPLMMPLQLANRFDLDAWDEKGELVRGGSGWWFSSKTHWCTPPYLPAPRIETIVYEEEENASGGGVFGWGRKASTRKSSVFVTPDTFLDLSMVRMGDEADELALKMETDGEVRTGVSSPKRYLWAKDASWLEGANWHMADPFGRFDARRHVTKLKGPFLKFFPEGDEPDVPEAKYQEEQLKPRYAPRLLMAGALYEIICQAYSFINTPGYRRAAGERGRMRRIKTVTLTYPSGMIPAERERLDKQARKALAVFAQTLGKAQRITPEFNLSIDEASAVHLTYIWSEVQKLGRKPSLWFRLVGRKTEPLPAPDQPPASEDETADKEKESKEKETKSVTGGRLRPGIRPRVQRPIKADPGSEFPEVRVACIDIGGGTSDLMIAKYQCEARAGGDRIHGETLHRDGISLAGDQLVKRLLERIIVPHFADVIGIEDHDVQRLFGPEIAESNREFRAQRILWINRLFVPLAQAYLDCAVNDLTDVEVSHLNPETVDLDVVKSLQRTIDQFWRVGEYSVQQQLGLYFDRELFEDVVHEVFDSLIFDFCESIVEHQADIVLLAGLPTKLRYIQDLVRTYLPLPESRIIPMYNRYVGTWYPYQNPDHLNPGVIVDPKSTVVVGAALEFSARFGMLAQFKFKLKDDAAKRSYYWGVMTESRIDKERTLFQRLAPGERPPLDEATFEVSAQRLVLGRKRRDYENAQASPVYVLKIDPAGRLGEIDVKLKLKRTTGSEQEEQLELVSAEGMVAGQPAAIGKNVLFEWRTLADERYYLDTGGLDRIELGR